MFAMKQDHGETALAFASRAKGKARNCKLSVKCSCDPPMDVDYTDQMVMQVVLAGMYDEEIRRKVLTMPDIDK